MAKRLPADLRLANSGTHAKVLVDLDDIHVTTPTNLLLFRTGKIKIFQGDRIVITGANGVGKSQLIRLLRQNATPGLTIAPSVITGYVDQQMSQLPATDTAIAFIAGSFRLGDQRSTSLLAGAGFDVETQKRPISKLSPGQKARLGLLALRLAEPNFYLLDEPTNHMDIPGQERLESEILTHGATSVLVSHDRYFVRAIATRILHINRGRLTED